MTLAETLREWVEHAEKLERRNEELEMNLRESNDEIANAKARVRELEAQIAALEGA
jgi:peptidoglycan hydrolase CwlO-like protein